ncbi:MAG: cytochrome P450 [Erythrobacter sp.]|nr:cytochrome P450 [Erythrobacter sp.]NCQ63301.1 cytochrome P450 [Alphaproteobacteria bacterium]
MAKEHAVVLDPDPPRLHLKDSGAATLPSLGKVLRDPAANWPARLLDTGIELAMAERRRIAFVAEPEAVSTILQNRNDAFPRARIQDRILGASYGENLIQAQQEDWRRTRRNVAQPITSERALSLVPRIHLALADMLAEWEGYAQDEPIPLQRDARRLTLDTLHRAMFADENEARQRDSLVDQTARSIADRHPIELKEELGLLSTLATRLVGDWQDRHGTHTPPPFPQDLNTLTLFLHAGHDNASAAFTWMLWLVAHLPELQKDVREEWRANREGVFSLSRLPVALAVVRETLRLYPPVIQVIREVRSGLAVGEVELPAGSLAIMSIYAMQRHRAIWSQPDDFRPERFVQADGDERRRRAAWMPFGTGPRGCTGSSLAQIELVLFLALICDRFDIAPNPACPLRMAVEWTQRPVGERPIFLRARR